MSLLRCATLLLLLGAVTPGHAADQPQCSFPNNTAQDHGYQMSVTPESLSNSTTYTVTVTGNGEENVVVLFEALESSNKSVVGTWSAEGTGDCSGRPLRNFIFNKNNSLVANWTSPPSSVPKSVDIIVSITNTSVTYRLSKTLESGSENVVFSIQPLSMFLALGLLVITNKLL